MTDLWPSILNAAVILLGVYWAFVAGRVRYLTVRVPTVRSGLDVPMPEGGWPSVSVVVPAHNEERVIERCARSLLASDYPNLEVIIVLDRCTDRTLAILQPIAASDRRLTIVENSSCPSDWAGKCNAARLGAERATGRHLLFTDADAAFHPQLVKAAMGTAIRDRRGLLSLLPTLVAEAWYEVVVQPAAAILLLRMYPIDKVNRDRRRRPFANGQFLLFDRAVYEAVGGHAAVKDDLLEDIAFARLVDAADRRCGLAIAEELLEVHMYPSFDALRSGWKRIFIEACHRRTDRLRGYAVRLLALGVVGPILQCIALALGLWAGGATATVAMIAVAGGWLAQLLALAIIYSASRTPLRGIFLYPLGVAYVASFLWQAASDLRSGKPVRWGGREYVLAPRP